MRRARFSSLAWSRCAGVRLRASRASQSPFQERELVRTLYRFDLEVYVEFRPAEMIRRRTPDARELDYLPSFFKPAATALRIAGTS
jgi:hypothetical protein